MRSLFALLSCLLFFFVHSPAQEWAPVGARWYYGTILWWPSPGTGYTTIEVIGETEINGIPVKVLEGACGCAQSPMYTYEEQGRVYLYVEALQEFRLYYDFNLSAGDTLLTFDDALLQEVPVLVESVTTLDWNGRNLNVQNIQYLEPGYHEWGEQIIEGIGSNRCLNFIYPACDPVGGYIRCYEDPDEGMLMLDNNVPSCTYTFTSAKEEDGGPAGWKIFPNPAGDEITVDFGQPAPHALHLRLLSQFGQALEERQLPPNTERAGWDVGGLPPGLYFIEVRMGWEIWGVKKIVKGR
ncbi:MAG: T9SS type A sorting domain-containing protein [Phaeodactylibacter sp.]|nr:T9SS type A sorting domain-containing protein [Phaeodactylibacter sp.]